MRKIVLAITAFTAFAFADNFTDEALRKGDSMTVSEQPRNAPEKMTATPAEIKDAASSVDSIKPAHVGSVKVVKNNVQPIKSAQKTKKIAKKQVKTKKIAKKSTKKAHKKVAKKSHKSSKKHSKKA